MDFVIFFTVALFTVTMAVKNGEDTPDKNTQINDVSEDMSRKAKLNETFYHDEQAFCEIINALGDNNIGGKL